MAGEEALEREVRSDAGGESPARGGETGGPERDATGGSGFDWGIYEPAIRRWERVIGEPVPDPVDDRGRLEPKFVEWMMGFPAGWTSTIKVRSHSLRALGNAVVPQQAAEALARLFAIAEAT